MDVPSPCITSLTTSSRRFFYPSMCQNQFRRHLSNRRQVLHRCHRRRRRQQKASSKMLKLRVKIICWRKLGVKSVTPAAHQWRVTMRLNGNVVRCPRHWPAKSLPQHLEPRATRNGNETKPISILSPCFLCEKGSNELSHSIVFVFWLCLCNVYKKLHTSTIIILFTIYFSTKMIVIFKWQVLRHQDLIVRTLIFIWKLMLFSEKIDQNICYNV